MVLDLGKYAVVFKVIFFFFFFFGMNHKLDGYANIFFSVNFEVIPKLPASATSGVQMDHKRGLCFGYRRFEKNISVPSSKY